MITVYVEHYLNEAGKDFFSHWIKKVKEIISTQPGFISLEDSLNQDQAHKDWCASVLLKFTDEKKLNLWAATPEKEFSNVL